MGEMGGTLETTPMVETLAVLFGDALKELAERDGVRTLFESKGSPHDVQADTQLCLGQLTHHFVKEFIWNLCIIRLIEPCKVVWHRKNLRPLDRQSGGPLRSGCQTRGVERAPACAALFVVPYS